MRRSEKFNKGKKPQKTISPISSIALNTNLQYFGRVKVTLDNLWISYHSFEH